MKNQFDRKVFTPKIFFKEIFFVMGHMPKAAKAIKNKRISKAFISKVMTVSTAVNGCVYCEWYHAKEAAASGISEVEIKNMLNLQFQADASEHEVNALLYTQHYAETSQNPDPEMTQKFRDFYGEKMADDIYIFIRTIYFGNLLGNTWDAVLSRFKGKPAPDSKLWFELVFFLLTFLIMFPAMWMMKRDEKKKVKALKMNEIKVN